jgi:hypothetical protein
MRPDPKKAAEKALRQLFLEWRRHWQHRHDSGQFVELDEPYQRGWDRYYVLRSDVKARRDAHVISRMLDLANSKIHCRRKDFTWKGRKNVRVPIPQPINRISVKVFDTLSMKEQSFWEKFSYYQNKNLWVDAYRFKFPWMFEFKIVPHMITERWVPDEAWETRRKELSAQIEANGYWPKIGAVMGWNNSVRDRFTGSYNNLKINGPPVDDI